MTTLTLYELVDEYRSASERMMDLEFDEATITDTLEGLSGDLTTKMNNIAQMTRNFDSAVDAIKEAEKKMKQRRDSISKRAEWLHFYLKSNMERAGIKKIESPFFTISIRDNPPSVDIFDHTILPDEYQRIETVKTPDKTMIKDSIKSGKEVPGAKLSHSTRLDIR